MLANESPSLTRAVDEPITTKQIGTISEAAVIFRFAQLGFRASLPLGEHSPYDMIVESPQGDLLRIQGKSGRIINEAISFSAVSSHHHRGKPAKRYDGKVDAFAVYCPQNGECYVMSSNDTCVRSD